MRIFFGLAAVVAIAVVISAQTISYNPLPRPLILTSGSAGPSGPTGATGTAGPYTATFLLCAGPCVALTDTSYWKWTAPFALSITSCIVDASTYPTGAALTVDVLKGGATTIFSSTVPTLADGSSSYNEQTGMAAAATLAKGDYLLAKVLTVGSTIAGQNVNVVCRVQP